MGCCGYCRDIGRELAGYESMHEYTENREIPINNLNVNNQIHINQNYNIPNSDRSIENNYNNRINMQERNNLNNNLNQNNNILILIEA